VLDSARTTRIARVARVARARVAVVACFCDPGAAPARRAARPALGARRCPTLTANIGGCHFSDEIATSGIAARVRQRLLQGSATLDARTPDALRSLGIDPSSLQAIAASGRDDLLAA
jgi:Asp/Glu/hydantoin racemase